MVKNDENSDAPSLKKEWRKLFQNAGFIVKTKHIKDLKSKKKWKREFGTLFILGKKPEK